MDDEEWKLGKELLKAVSSGNLKKVEECLFKGADVNFVEKICYTESLLGDIYCAPFYGIECPLRTAVARGYTDIVKLLLEYGADVYIVHTTIAKIYGERRSSKDNKTYILREAKTDEIRQLLLKAANPNR